MSEIPGLVANTVDSPESLLIPQVISEVIDTDNDGPVYLLTANGENGLEYRVVDIRNEIPQAFPPRSVEPRLVTDKASLLGEVNRRPLVSGLSTAWANRNAGTVTVIYDDLDVAGDSWYAKFTNRDDQLVLKYVEDPNWAVLMKAINAEPCGQEEFSDLIENVGHLITSHPAAELVEIALSLRASTSGSFESKINRANGSQVLAYSEEVTATAGRTTQIEVPQTITFRAARFEGFPPIDVTCWLRLRTGGGRVRLSLAAQPFDHVLREAWNTEVEDLATELGVPVYAANL